MFNANYILFSHVVRNRMLSALERLCAYKKNPKYSLREHIDVMYKKLWTFHVICCEHYELLMELQMWIVLNSLFYSWECERKVLVENTNKLIQKKRKCKQLKMQ